MRESRESGAPVRATRVELPASYRFDPPAIEVTAGAAVTWHNADHFTHSVKVEAEGFPYLELRPGDSGSITFERPGTYPYICTYHPHDMRGRVIVVEG